MARQRTRRSKTKKVRQKKSPIPATRRGATKAANRGAKPRARAKRAAATRARSRPFAGSRVARVTAGRFRHGTAASSSPETEGQPPGELAEVLPSAVEEVRVVVDRARADAQSMTGEELPGGSVAVPDNDRVDAFAGALGVERSPDAPLRTSGEILDRRDRRRGGRKPPPTL